MNKTWHQYQKYIIKLLNQHFALGFRQDTEKTGHHLGFARKFQGIYLPHRQDTMPCNYPFSWPWNRKWDISGKKCFHPTPLLQNNKVSNASLSQMFAKALHWNCCSNQSAYWKLLGFGNNFCKIPDYIFLEKITNLLRTKNLKEKIWSLNLRFLLHSISLSQDHP